MRRRVRHGRLFLFVVLPCRHVGWGWGCRLLFHGSHLAIDLRTCFKVKLERVKEGVELHLEKKQGAEDLQKNSRQVSF